jgi:mono/diheme cytochrome c family protein
MIPPKGYMRRVILTLVIVSVPLLLGLIFTYDIIKINWASNMKFQISVDYQDGPRKWTPNDAIQVAGPSGPAGGIPENPVPADPVSLDRGRQLFDRNCALCHGQRGQGDGPITQFWNPQMRKPANLTDERMKTMSDGTVYITISNGYGTMPPLRENLDVRERWDTVNYVKTLSQ